MNGSNLPRLFLERMKTQLGKDYDAFLRTYEEPARRALRLNPMKKGNQSFFGSGKKVPWEENGRYLDPESNAGSTVWHEAGAFYLQEPGAMLPAAVLNAQPGETILDLCAAPGGKTTQAALAMKGKGLIIANEPIYKRAKILSSNIERMGVSNAVAVSALPGILSEKWPNGFDAVLADVPCSGEGMFRRDPGTAGQWTLESAEGCVKRQREILREAVQMVRPGGRLVYSTCTWNPEENEKNVFWLLKEYPEFYLEPFLLPGADGSSGMAAVLPHIQEGEGQFAALLRRKGDGEAVLSINRTIFPPTSGDRKLFSDMFPMYPEPNLKIGQTLIYLPECPDLSGLSVLRAGVHLGTIRSGIVIPDHAAAMSVLATETPSLNLNEKEAAAFLAGETIEREGITGWIPVSFDGLKLGWGKGSSGQIKNHYPKGLRRRNVAFTMS